MRGKGLLVAFLLGLGLCFVSGAGYGEVQGIPSVTDIMLMRDLILLEAKVDYMMRNPTTFLNVNFYYDPKGTLKKTFELPEGVDTEKKIFVRVQDNRDVFRYQSGTALLSRFKRELEAIYSFLSLATTSGGINADIVAIFYSRESIPLGYFYQGEYHLWEE